MMEITWGFGGLLRQPGGKTRKMASLIAAAALALSAQTEAGASQASRNVTARTSPAAEEKTDGETGYTYILREGSGEEGEAAQWAVITGYAGSQKTLEIPRELGGCKVRGIGDGAFRENQDIAGAVIPEGVESIGFEAFRGCGNLAEVSIPASITDWNDHVGNGYRSSAFEDCAALAELSLAEGLTVLGQRAFAGCAALEEVAVPSSVETFHNEVFADCRGLESLELREGIRQIGYHAFAGCISLKEARIPSTVERWDIIRASGIMATTYACAPFSGCVSLEKVEFAPGLKTLSGFEGVPNCPGVRELTVPDSVQDIKFAFAGCNYLEKVTLGKGITKIGQNAFEGCVRLADVEIPYTVTDVGAGAFRNCAALERLVFPPSAVNLEGGITYGCGSLKELYLLAGAVSWYQALNLPSDGKLYCLEGSGTYGSYLSGMPGEEKRKLAAVPSAGAEAEGCDLAYDGVAHEAAAVSGIREGDRVLYRLDGGNYQEEVPKLTEPGSGTLEIGVMRAQPGELLQYSSLRVRAQIAKRQYGMVLQDVEAWEGETYEVAVQGYGGNASPALAYFEDAGCARPLDGKPEAAGTYYVRASVPETEYDAPVESNVAKITIRGKEAPGTEPPAGGNPGEGPSGSGAPGQSPGAGATASPAPGGSSGAGASPSPAPGGSSGAGAPASPAPGGRPGEGGGAGKKPSQTAKPNKKTAPEVKRAVIRKVRSIKRKTLSVQWKRVAGASGYQVRIATNRKFTRGRRTCLVRGEKKGKKLVGKLRGGRRYFVRVRAYKSARGKRHYGKWSKVKSAKVK